MIFESQRYLYMRTPGDKRDCDYDLFASNAMNLYKSG